MCYQVFCIRKHLGICVELLKLQIPWIKALVEQDKPLCTKFTHISRFIIIFIRYKDNIHEENWAFTK